MQKTIEKRPKRRGGDPFFGMYLRDIANIPLLTVEEEKELGRRIQKGDPDALQKLIESNLRFVIKVARKFVRRPDQLMEFVNVGNVGLIEAARRFDPDKNVRFTSYAVWWIRQAIFHHLAGMTHAFRVSPKMANILYRVARVLNQSALGADEIRDRKQFAGKIGVSVRDLSLALDTMAGTLSLDQTIYDEGDLTLGDNIPQTSILSPEEQAMIESVRHSLRVSIEKLTPKEQSVIRLRFGLNGDAPMTLEQVGSKMSLSRERIRQIERDALKKMREIYSTHSVSNYLN